MKRFVFLLAFAMAIVMGCTKESTTAEPKTTYTFVAEGGVIAMTQEPMLTNNYYNVAVDVVFSEYGEGHRIAYQTINGAVDGQKYTFEANSKTEYVTVRIDVKGDHKTYDSIDYKRYFGNVFFLEKGRDTKITFDKGTMVSSKEPQ